MLDKLSNRSPFWPINLWILTIMPLMLYINIQAENCFGSILAVVMGAVMVSLRYSLGKEQEHHPIFLDLEASHLEALNNNRVAIVAEPGGRGFVITVISNSNSNSK